MNKKTSILLSFVLLFGWLFLYETALSFSNTEISEEESYFFEIAEDRESIFFFNEDIIAEKIKKLEEALRNSNTTLKNDNLVTGENILGNDWIDVIIQGEEYYEELSLEEWDRMMEEYGELGEEYRNFFPGDKSYEDLENRMREILSKISAGEIDIETILSFGDPRQEGLIFDGIFKVTEIMVQETFFREDGIEEIGKIFIKGIGPPDSEVVIFIYSTPIIVNTRTDSQGNWTYILEKELEDGRHEIYVASVDNTGKILARSSPAPFIKEAAAVQMDFIPFLGSDGDLSFFNRNIILILVTIFAIIVLTTIVLAGIAIGKRKDMRDV